MAWWAVLLAKYSAATRRTSRITADIAGQGVIVNRLVIDMSVLALRIEISGKTIRELSRRSTLFCQRCGASRGDWKTRDFRATDSGPN
jgi:hypothetical protein